MKSVTTRTFRETFAKLPQQIQKQFRAAYGCFQVNPHHTGLQFKRVGRNEPVYSARINDDYRALCLLENGTANWFWVGKHSVYEQKLKAF